MLVLKKCLFGLTTVVTIIHITAADNYSESSLGYVSGINTSNEENKKNDKIIIVNMNNLIYSCTVNFFQLGKNLTLKIYLSIKM